jgi:hypothetical protein
MGETTHSKHRRRHESAEITPPKRLQRKIIRHLLKTEQHAPNRTPKRDAHARRRARTQYLARLRRVPPILVEEPANHIPGAHRIMHARALLAHTQSTRNCERQPNAFDKQRREPQEALHDEPRDDALHLADAAARRIRRKALDQARGREGEHPREGNVDEVAERPEPRAPALPLGAPGLGAPAAEALVEVEGRGAVAQFNIGQPFGHDVEERGVEADGRPDERDYDPCLAGIIRLCYFGSPAPVSAAQKCAAIGVAGP